MLTVRLMINLNPVNKNRRKLLVFEMNGIEKTVTSKRRAVRGRTIGLLTVRALDSVGGSMNVRYPRRRLWLSQ